MQGMTDDGEWEPPTDLWLNRDCILSIAESESKEWREIHTTTGAYYINPISVEDTLEALLERFGK